VIRVRRTAAPRAIVRNGANWLASLFAATTKEQVSAALGKYKHPEIRTALEQLFHEKCAYCESLITHVTWTHIEHFRPKAVSRYRRYAFTWSNLLLSCTKCNGAPNKGNQFPLAAAGGPLIDPTRDDPSAHFDFDYDITTRIASVIPTTTRGRTTEQILGLNRQALVRHRSDVVRRLLLIKAHANADPHAAAEVLNAQRDDAEYLAFARKFLV
jgi:uncharacterized protein (TIGR02646 family)